MINFKYNDGGRSASKFKGTTGGLRCEINSNSKWQNLMKEIYNDLFEANKKNMLMQKEIMLLKICKD